MSIEELSKEEVLKLEILPANLSFTNGMMAGNAGDSLAMRLDLAPALYIVGLIVMNVLSVPLAIETMPEACPENSGCDHRQIMIDVSDEELQSDGGMG